MGREANWRVPTIFSEFKFEAKGGVSAIKFVGGAGQNHDG